MSTLGERIRATRKKRNLTQSELAEACGWDSGQARIGNYESGRRSPSIDDVRTLAHALGVGIWELITDDEANMVQGSRAPYGVINEFVVINQYSAAGSAGNGHMNDHVEVTGGLAFKRAWLQRRHLNPLNLHVIYVYGDSMESTISDGDVVLMDESQTEPLNNKIFVIRADGELLIKRLIRSLTGNWIVRSDNEDKRQYPDFELSPSSLAELTILGRVVWHGGDL